ncbi:uncharacterized protein LOC122363431 [Amphibalanus amphitrite]|uniref:uncharacterized protein LOC122363431 n=1 Tax=Amphibalanus amphitrite TaxID=1232801 RepID=UPI001C90D4EE|nr:uncharacterized protein LOC122363431 [Amphibalanus amphitrite]
MTLLTATLTLLIPDSETLVVAAGGGPSLPAADAERRSPVETAPGQPVTSRPPAGESIYPSPSNVPAGLLVLLMVLSVAGVTSSILLVIGLAKGRRRLLVPLVVILSCTALLDQAVLLTRVVLDVRTYHTISSETISLCIIDTVVLGINLLCLVCVISQYQKYAEAAGGGPAPSQLSMRQTKITDPTTLPGLSAETCNGRTDNQPSPVSAAP